MIDAIISTLIRYAIAAGCAATLLPIGSLIHLLTATTRRHVEALHHAHDRRHDAQIWD